MRPASTVSLWPQFTGKADPASIRASLEDVSLIAAPTEQEEAAAIALVLREAMETPGKTANLVTPDRALARRVAAELGRWGLTLATSGGEVLRATPAGVFHDLIAEAAATGSQIALLALLKHPLTRLGLPEGEAQSAARILEIAGMRQAWCGEGLDALARSLVLARRTKPRHRAIDRLSDEEWEAADALIAALKEALRPLLWLAAGENVPFAEIAAAHAKAAEMLAADEAGSSAALAQGADGAAMAAFMRALAGDAPGPAIALGDYPALFRSLIRLEKTRPAVASHPRLQILGAMEARLTSADLVVIAGLNEGTWPEAADPGPWLNRSTRAALGLPSPERRIRLAAHDFCQMMGAGEVVLTRSLKSGGAPTVPSRWLMRVEALLQGLGLDGVLAARKPWAQWSAARNQAEAAPPAKPPSPCPPLDARPRRLSVSDIQLLIANPYAIYARHILELSPLNPLEAGPGGAERGQIIHEMLHRFARRFPACCRPRRAANCSPSSTNAPRSMATTRESAHSGGRDWSVSHRGSRRPNRLGAATRRSSPRCRRVGPSRRRKGRLRLRARADRIDLHPDGGLALYDYKSGAMPTDAAVADFKAPQLPLEALIAFEGHYRRSCKPPGRQARLHLGQGRRPCRAGTRAYQRASGRARQSRPQRPHRADRALRRRGHALSGDAAGRVYRQLPFRRLRASGTRGRMEGSDRRGDKGDWGTLLACRSPPLLRMPGGRLPNSRGWRRIRTDLGLGFGECGHGKNACAGAARAASFCCRALRRKASSA